MRPEPDPASQQQAPAEREETSSESESADIAEGKESADDKLALDAPRGSVSPDAPGKGSDAPAAERKAPSNQKPAPGAGDDERAKGAEPDEAATQKDPRHVRAFPPLGGSEAAKRGCQTDADCTVSCRRDGRCCLELCGCSQIYNKSYATQLEARARSHCAPDVICPVARCVGQKGGTATCQDNLCTLVGTAGASK